MGCKTRVVSGRCSPWLPALLPRLVQCRHAAHDTSGASVREAGVDSTPIKTEVLGTSREQEPIAQRGGERVPERSHSRKVDRCARAFRGDVVLKERLVEKMDVAAVHLRSHEVLGRADFVRRGAAASWGISSSAATGTALRFSHVARKVRLQCWRGCPSDSSATASQWSLARSARRRHSMRCNSGRHTRSA